MSLELGLNLNTPFSEIEFISKDLHALVNNPPDETETNKTIEKLNTVLNRQMPQLIEDIAIHPDHRKTWRNICSNLRKLDVREFKKIQGTISKLTHIGLALSNQDKATKTLGVDLQKYANSLKNERNVEENLRSAGLILTNYFKLFRGIDVSGEPLSEGNYLFLLRNLNDFKNELNDIKENFPEVSSHPLFEKLEKLVHKLSGKDFLEFQLSESRSIPDDNKPSILRFLPPDLYSLGLIREEIQHNRSIGYAALAGWIDYNKIPLGRHLLSLEELKGIQSQIRYVDFTGFNFDSNFNLNWLLGWNEEMISDFIQNCQNIETLRIKTDKIRTFPDRIKQLKVLDCGGCTNLTALPVMNSLLKFNCQDCTALTNLPMMNSLKDLHCKSCTALTELPELNTLEKLYCHSCTALIKLPSLNFLKALNCENCTELTELEEMDALKEFNCIGCTNLRVLPRMNSLEILHCKKCTALLELPRLNSLRDLNCEGCTTLIQLPEMNTLVKLLCSDCTALTKLARMNSLVELNCQGCTFLTELSVMNSLIMFICKGCIGLTQLPSLNLLRMLICIDCTALTELPQMNLIEAIECSGCTALRELPNIGVLKSLDCTNCTALTELPTFNLLRILSCAGCTGLTELPMLIHLEMLTCNDCTALTALPNMNGLTYLDCSNCINLTELPMMNFVEALRYQNCTSLTNADQYSHIAGELFTNILEVE